jgi:hypothetical protein
MWKIQENRAIKQGGKLLVKKALEQGSVEYSELWQKQFHWTADREARYCQLSSQLTGNAS